MNRGNSNKKLREKLWLAEKEDIEKGEREMKDHSSHLIQHCHNDPFFYCINPDPPLKAKIIEIYSEYNPGKFISRSVTYLCESKTSDCHFLRDNSEIFPLSTTMPNKAPEQQG